MLNKPLHNAVHQGMIRCSAHEPLEHDQIFIMSQFGVSALSVHVRTALASCRSGRSLFRMQKS